VYILKGLNLTYQEERANNHFVKAFLDIIVLAILYENPSHGYKLIEDIHNNFGVLLSPGTLYPLLYRLEERNLIEVEEVQRSKVYRLTSEGNRRLFQIIKIYREKMKNILEFIEDKLN